MNERRVYVGITSKSNPSGVGRPDVVCVCLNEDDAKQFLKEYVRDDILSYPEPCYSQTYDEILEKAYHGINTYGYVALQIDPDDPLSVFRLYKIEKTTITGGDNE